MAIIIYKWRGEYWAVDPQREIYVAHSYLGFIKFAAHTPESHPEEQLEFWILGIDAISNPIELLLLAAEGEVVAPFPYQDPAR